MAAETPEFRPQPFDPVYVLWNDAFDEGTAQFTSPADAIASYKVAQRRQLGYWVGRTKDVVVIASTDDRAWNGRLGLGGLTFIPAGMVEDVSPVVPPPKVTSRVRK